VAIGNKLVLEESTRLGNQIVAGAANNFDPGKCSHWQFTPHANLSFSVRRFSWVSDKIN